MNTLGLRLARLTSRHPWWIVLVSILLTFLAARSAAQLSIDTSLEALMPKGVASVENLEQVLEKTGSFSSAMVVIDTANQQAAEAFAEDLSVLLRQRHDWVGAAHYWEDFSVFEQHKLLYLEESELTALLTWTEERVLEAGAERLSETLGAPVNIRIRAEPSHPSPARGPLELLEAEAGKNPAGRNGSRRFFRSEAGNILLLVVWPLDAGGGLGQSRKILDDLNRSIAELEPDGYDARMTVAVGGRIYNRVVQFDAVISDLKTGGYLTLGLVLALLITYFRGALSVLVIAPPLIISIVWTMGLAALTTGQLNLVTIFLVLILFGLGVDFGIHNLARYGEIRAAGGGHREGIETMFSETGAASLIAGGTTAIAFLSLGMTDFRAFSEFGLIAGSGIVCAYIAMYSLMPALLTLANRHFAKFPQATSGRRLSVRPVIGRAVLYVSVPVLAGLMLIAFGVNFENDFGRLQAERSAEHKALQAKISEVFPDGTDRAVLAVDTLDEVRALTRVIEDKIKADTESPTIKKIESILSYLPDEDLQAARLQKISEIKTSLDQVASADFLDEFGEGDWSSYFDIGTLEAGDLPEGMRRIYTGVPGSDGYLIYIFNSVSMNDARLARAFADDIRVFEVDGKQYFPAAEGIVFVDMLNLMKRDAGLAVLLVTIATILCLFAFFRNLPMAISVILPVIAGLIITFSAMALLGIKLNIFNMVILPTLVGIGVDNGVHIARRFKESGNICDAVQRTGGAAGIATLTTMFGFAGLVTAEMGGLQSLGLVAIIGFMSCLMTTWLLLPPLLVRLTGAGTGS